MIPALLQRLCDNAAIFPPGLMPLDQAVPAHAEHERAPYSDMVGAFIVSADVVPELPALLADRTVTLPLAVTAPKGPHQLSAVLKQVPELPVDVKTIEVAVPGAADEFFADLASVLTATDHDVFVEVPRDDRRQPILEMLARTPYKAKFRTGGVRADMHPDEAELALAITAVVGAGLPFKATAGLHHAVRNTAPATGFEQHGFLNVMLAVDAALRGKTVSEVASELALRDEHAIAARITELDDTRVQAIRATFAGFGTCSIAEPLADLIALGLVPARLLRQESQETRV
ncbi:hypothetical protein ONR57_13350 [Hoyosella sp. YIM 151337]|uniref:hypothetical protein n=1 Tax=Hoyosella sp. YIM 151337 TaxID=2992742 RepID=UPI0022355C43|nr:hypothetical protein [Hoyosella sp. YIM 151337]MCW4354287.1 hypothetical protein [Hoyosella sp. YIM 151337]